MVRLSRGEQAVASVAVAAAFAAACSSSRRSLAALSALDAQERVLLRHLHLLTVPGSHAVQARPARLQAHVAKEVQVPWMEQVQQGVTRGHS